ncbi:MAG: hypothetical protein U1F83_05570 [Verrucomicrobiota bacterium]
MNVNFLGEAILSEPESERRLQQYLAGLRPETEVVSIKISTSIRRFPRSPASTPSRPCATASNACSGIADRARFTRPNGEVVPKFVYLDMEEYRDKGADRGRVHAHAGSPGPHANAGGDRVAELHS